MKRILHTSSVCFLVLVQMQIALFGGAEVVCVGPGGHFAVELDHRGVCDEVGAPEDSNVVELRAAEGCIDSAIQPSVTPIRHELRPVFVAGELSLCGEQWAFNSAEQARVVAGVSPWRADPSGVGLIGTTILQI